MRECASLAEGHDPVRPRHHERLCAGRGGDPTELAGLGQEEREPPGGRGALDERDHAAFGAAEAAGRHEDDDVRARRHAGIQ